MHSSTLKTTLNTVATLDLLFFSQILEPRFNSDTLAVLLNIPPQKTLLRRHLATNFNTLVGSQAQQEKQEYLESSGYTPLNTTAKVRVRKRRFVLSLHFIRAAARFLFNLSWCSTCVLTLPFRLVHLDQMCWASAPTVCNTLTKHNEALDETCPSSFRQLSYPFIFLITERVCV